MEREEINPFLINVLGMDIAYKLDQTEYFAAVEFLLNTKLNIPKRKSSVDTINQYDLDGKSLKELVAIAGEDAMMYLDDYDYESRTYLTYTKTEDDESYFNRVYKYLRKRSFPVKR